MSVHKMIKSEALSTKGWKFSEWFKGNWGTLKEVIKIGIPLLVGLQLFKDNPAMIGLVTALGKLLLDTGQYYFKEYK